MGARGTGWLDVDCGGPTCAQRCLQFAKCNVTSDCTMLCAAGSCGDGNGLAFNSPGQTCQTLKFKYPTYNGSAQYWIQGLNFVWPSAVQVTISIMLSVREFFADCNNLGKICGSVLQYFFCLPLAT